MNRLSASHSRRNRIGWTGLWIVALLAVTGDAAAQIYPSTPAHFSIFYRVQFPPRDVPVYGVAINLAGIQDEVNGFAIGIYNEVGDLDGFSGGGINVVDGNANGIQYGAHNVVGAKLTGIQLGGVVNQAAELSGAQLGLVNVNEKGRGFQLGFANVSESLRGVQIGLLNFNSEGFLPFFPLINFNF